MAECTYAASSAAPSGLGCRLSGIRFWRSTSDGEGYEVGNFGRNGATLLRKGHNPYCKTAEFAHALEFAPDIAVIHLGTNDTDPRNWPDSCRR